jgi:1-acyl-sn-glycerol-3-phosphate acyltransferase
MSTVFNYAIFYLSYTCMSPKNLLQILRLSTMTIGYSLYGLSFALFDKDYRLFYRHGFHFAEAALRIGKISLEIEGKEHLQRGQTYVFVANHTSIFDIPAVWITVATTLATVPDDETGGRLRIIYKRSLELIPFLGWELKMSPFIPIQRERARRSMRSIEAAVQAVQTGESVIIFPEGTRSRSGRLMDFRRGAFHLAARAKKPIVPVAIIGAHTILQADSVDMREGTIRIVLGKPVPPPEQDDRLVERSLMKHIHAVLAAMLPDDQKPA